MGARKTTDLGHNEHDAREYRYWDDQVFWTKRMAIYGRGAFVAAAIYVGIAAVQLYVSERPYLGIKSAQPRTFAIGQPVEVAAVIVNSGRTSATHVIPRSAVRFAKPGELIDWQKLTPHLGWSTIYQSNMAMLPLAPFGFPEQTDRSLTATDVAEINSGTEKLVVLTAADYLDQFLVAHHLRACETYRPQSNEFLFCKDDRHAE